MFCFQEYFKVLIFLLQVIHDIHFFARHKHQMNNCTLIGDRGYLSTQVQTDLFNYSNIKLDTPMRSNQKIIKSRNIFLENQERESKRYFLNFDQFKIRNNYAKSFNGFKTRILSKITALTFYSICKMFLYLIEKMNKIKVSLI